MSDLSPEARQLLDAARDAVDPTPADQERVRRAFAASLGTPALTPAAAQAAGAATAASGMTVKGIVAAAVLVAGLGAGGLWRASRSVRPGAATTEHVSGAQTPATAALAHSTPPSPAALEATRAPSQTAAAPTVARPVAPTVEPPIVPARERSLASRLSGGEAAPAGTLALEVSRLQRAQDALTRGVPAEALAELGAYDAQFRRGVLREDARAMRVFTLCALGRSADAHAEAEGFLRASPHSPLAPRVRASCAGPEAPGATSPAPDARTGR